MNTKPDLVIEKDTTSCFPKCGAFYSDMDMRYLDSLTPQQREKRARMLMGQGSFDSPLKLHGDYSNIIKRIERGSKP